jgi:hypothetical protein
MTNERHFAVVLLKDKTGEKVQNIIEKAGPQPFSYSVDRIEDASRGLNYAPKPVQGTINPYYRKK